MKTRSGFFIGLIVLSIFVSCKQMPASRLFVGGFTGPGEKGLTLFDFNERSGELVLISQSDVGPNPSYFCFSDRNNLLYVANEVMEFNGVFGGGLSAFRYNEKEATLEKQNEMIIPNGGPCYISMSPDSGFLFIANYPKGSVAVVKLNAQGLPETVTDTLLFLKDRANASHAHMITADPAGKLIYVTDLGQDKIFRFNFRIPEGKLIPLDTLNVPEKYGPRHFVFGNNGEMLYVINELGSKITVFSTGARPELVQTLPTVREGYAMDNSCADLHISNDGRFLYGSNRGENTIVTFAIQPDGTLKLAGHTSCGGDWPRNFTLDPSGRFLLAGNQKSDTIVVFRLNQKSGLPDEKPEEKFKLTAPACLKFY